MCSLFEQYRTFLSVDLKAIQCNGLIARKTFDGQQIMCVLKADAYGHGIEGVLPAYEHFADAYAVATVEEGLIVRKGSKKPVLLFGPVPKDKIIPAAENNLTFTVGSIEYAKRLAAVLRTAGLKACCHLKVDTGLNRSGIGVDTSLEQLKELYDLQQLVFTGSYTHFACGEGTESWELTYTQQQFEKFQLFLNRLRDNNFPIGVCHCCSTGGALVHPEYRLDMVRLGMMPLGMSYSDESVRELGLKPVAKWISYIAQIKDVPKGDAISYGCTFQAEKDMKIALVTCGYADGYRRVYSNKTTILLNGRHVPVVGRVAMDYMLIDITDVPDIEIGDAVTLLGVDGDAFVSAQQLAQFGESVSGEVTCAISARVPRIYLD